MSRRAGIVVVVLALLAASVFYAATERINRNDAALYFQVAKNLSEGNGFSSKTEAPHNWVGTREPLYPLLLSVPFRFFGASLSVVFVVQAVMHALTALLAGRIVLRLVGSSRAATAAAVLVGVFPTLANYTVYTLRETPFTFLVTLATYLTMIAVDRATWGRFAWAGLAWGVANLCRGVALPLPVVLGGVAVILAWRSGRVQGHAALRHAVVLVAFTAVPMLPWMAYTARVDAEWSPTPRAWQNVYVRASKVLLTPPEMKMYAVYCLSESLADRIFPGHNLRSVGEGYFYRGFGEKVRGLRATGMSDDRVVEQVRREAIALIREHPIRYAFTGVFEFVKFNSFFQVPVVNEQGIEARYGRSFPILFVRGVSKVAGFVLLALFVIGAWTLGARGAVLVTVAVYFNLVHLALDSIGRYALPIIPCYLVLAFVAVRHVRGEEATVPRETPRWVPTPVSS